MDRLKRRFKKILHGSPRDEEVSGNDSLAYQASHQASSQGQLKSTLKKSPSPNRIAAQIPEVENEGATSRDSQASSSRQVPRAQVPEPVAPEKHGLFILHPPPELRNHDTQFEIDIVAVHGLNGNARKSWQDGTPSKLWLEDFLPSAVPKARVMTFGYNSQLAFSRSTAGIDNFANDLLNRLRMMRGAPEAQKRPLLFVAHSLGGIVVKKALIMAKEAEVFYGAILDSTVGIIFMGTPHRGSKLTWSLLFTNVINTAFLGRQAIRDDLLKEVDTGSITLKKISDSFVQRSKDLKIMSFIELEAEYPFLNLVVDDDSARMGLPNEMVFPVNAHHRNICCYPRNTHETYVLVESVIREMATAKEGQTSNFTTMKEHLNFVPPPISKATLASDSVSAGRETRAVHPKSSLKTRIASIEPLQPKKSVGKVSVLVSGLKQKLAPTMKLPRLSQTISLDVPLDLDVADLSARVLEITNVLPNFSNFRFNGRLSPIDTTWKDVFTTPVQVTSSRSSYDPDQGYKININQTIASFFSTAFPSPIQAKLHRYSPHGNDSERSSAIIFGQSNMQHGQIALCRSLRIPEDGKRHSLPAKVDTFPVLEVESFREHLPVSMVAQGGLFVLMEGPDALSIAFDSAPGKKFAIRPYVGGINGISGVSLFSQNSMTKDQDYVVLPEQERLDGIAVRPGVVRQFVATTLIPDSETGEPPSSRLKNARHNQHETLDLILPKVETTVEWQMTGRDSVGGIQLQIIPQFDVGRLYAGNTENVIANGFERSEDDQKVRLTSYQDIPPTATVFDVLQTPRELGLLENNILHFKDMSKLRSNRRKMVQDLFAETGSHLAPGGVLNLEVCVNEDSATTFNVRKAEPASQVSSFEFYSEDSFEDILATLRIEHSMPDSMLSMLFPTANKADQYVPILSWKDVGTLALTSNMCLLCREPPAPANALDLIIHNAEQSTQSDGVCMVECSKLKVHPHVPDAKKNLLLSMSRTSTITELCKEIQLFLGSPVSLFQTTKNKEFGFAKKGSDCVFDPDDDLERIPIFQILNEVPRFEVLVKTLTGRSTTLMIESLFTVLQMKEKLHDEVGIPPDQQRLIYRSKQLHDGLTAGHYNIGPGETIFLVLRLRGGGGPILFVMVFGQKVELAIHWSDEGPDRVANLKEELQKRTQLKAEQQILTFRGLELTDDQRLDFYEGKTIYLSIRPKEPRMLGIGAGGNITQDIERDDTDPRLWDTANSKIVFIHLLDASTCGSIPGLPLPHTQNSPNYYSSVNTSEVVRSSLWPGSAWDQLQKLPSADEKESTTYPNSETEDYTDSGLLIRPNNITTTDVDDTLPPLF